MSLVTCDNNCYLVDSMKIHIKFSFYETRQKLVLFILQVLLNIQKYSHEFCTCEQDFFCRTCAIAQTYKRTQYEVFEHCLNLDFLIDLEGRLHGSICFLLEKKSNFVCTMLEKDFYFEHKCFFTGNMVLIHLKAAYDEWELLKKKEIISKKCFVVLENVQLQKNS